MVEKDLPHLPNFRWLIKNGSWGAMLSTVPCDTPTNWTAISTGATAATSRITGFDLYLPGRSLKGRLRPSVDYAQVRAAEFLWEAADRQGKKAIMVNCPYSGHSRELNKGIIIGGDGMGPGLALIHGAGYICKPDRSPEMPRAKELRLRPDGSELTGTFAFGGEHEQIWSATGPLDTGKRIKRKAGNTIHVRIRVERQPLLVLEEESGKELASLSSGEWSSNIPVSVGEQEGRVRFFLADISEDGKSLQLYHSNIARRSGWSKPAGLCETLYDEIGPFHSGEETGVAVDQGFVPERNLVQAYRETLEDTGRTIAGYAAKFAGDIEDWDLMFLQLHSTDGLNHRRLGHLDPTHPRIDESTRLLAEEVFKANYEATDKVLGMVADVAERNGAVVVAVADHSAVPTHRWVDTSRPFQEKGLLFFRSDKTWDAEKSKVRHMINHSEYINLKGRQPDGIVELAEYERLRDEIISTLFELRDPRTGECPISVAARREDLESVGANGETFGDVVYLMRPGYTNQPCSEAKALNREMLAPMVADIDRAMETGFAFSGLQGNHHDYLPNAAYPGICTNRGILLFHGPGVRKGYRIRNARTIDITPTLAWWTDMAPPAQSEGRILSDVFEG